MLAKPSPKKNILLIEDDDSVVQMLAMLLETRGYNVKAVATGQEALDKITNGVDIILLDLTLPDFDGLDICRKFKDNESICHIPIIILSAKMLPQAVVDALYLGADDYLGKPFDYEELIARIEAVTRRSKGYQNGSFMNSGESDVIVELRQIINDGKVVPFYQPIFQIEPFQLYGFEALCRPDSKSILMNPEILFKAAIQFGVYQELEMLSWKSALINSQQYLNGHKLFLNCNPYFVESPKFTEIRNLFVEQNVNIDNIILEITERSAMSHVDLFYEQLKRYRQAGFKFAVDDVGGGFASLESIVKTKPEVLKIDRHIIEGIHEDEYKQSVVRFIISFCKENNIFSIAEGLETKQDLQMVKELGVDAVQGYYLSRPMATVNMQEVFKTRELIEAIK